MRGSAVRELSTLPYACHSLALIVACPLLPVFPSHLPPTPVTPLQLQPPHTLTASLPSSLSLMPPACLLPPQPFILAPAAGSGSAPAWGTEPCACSIPAWPGGSCSCDAGVGAGGNSSGKGQGEHRGSTGYGLEMGMGLQGGIEVGVGGRWGCGHSSSPEPRSGVALGPQMLSVQCPSPLPLFHAQIQD